MQGQDWGAKSHNDWGAEVHPGGYLAAEADSNVKIDGARVGDIARRVRCCGDRLRMAAAAAEVDRRHQRAQAQERAKMAETLARIFAHEFPQPLNVVRDSVKGESRSVLVNEAPTRSTHASTSGHVQARKRIDVGTWGIMASAWLRGGRRRGTKQQSDRDRGRQRLRLFGWKSRPSAAYNLPCASSSEQNNGVYRGTDTDPRAATRRRRWFVKNARTTDIEAFGGVGANATNPAELRNGHGRACARAKPTLNQRRHR